MNRFHGSLELATARTESETNEMENCEINVSPTEELSCFVDENVFISLSLRKGKVYEKVFSSSYRLSARAKSQLKNAKFAVASERKKQRFRPPLSDVVELLRLTLDTEKKKFLLEQKKTIIFYSASLLITALCEIMKNVPIFSIAKFALEADDDAVCFCTQERMFRVADIFIWYLIIPQWLASFRIFTITSALIIYSHQSQLSRVPKLSI